MPDDATPPADTPRAADTPVSEAAVPTEREDHARIKADEERLEALETEIAEAEQEHAEHEKSWQSGLLPQAEGDEGEGNASKLRG